MFSLLRQKSAIQRVQKSLNLQIRRCKHKLIYRMDKAYLRHSTEDEKFELSFQYIHQNLKVNRQFNFARSIAEPISSFLQRVSVNIEKEVRKRNKKVPQIPQVIVSLLESQNGDEIDENSLCKDIFTPKRDLTLKINHKEYQIVINPPWVSALSLPSSIMSGFHVYPKFDSLYTDLIKSDYIWFKSKDKKEWLEPTNNKSFMFIPTNDEIDYYLKLICTPKNDRLEGPQIEAESKVTVSAGPGLCPFEIRQKFTKEKCKGDTTFRVLTYNILANLYCDLEYTRLVLHPYCPTYALEMDYRKQLIIKEVLGYNSDLVCLQEVDRRVFKHDLNPVFQQFGFIGELCLKGATAEGLALFHNSEKFKQLASHRLLLSEEINTNPLFSDIWAKIETNEGLKDRLLSRTTTLQVNVLEFTSSGDILVVANTHLYFHPDSDHIRLIQAGLFIKFLEHLMGEIKNKFQERKVSVIFCGDFNSTPECGIYKLYTTGEVPEDCIDYQSNAAEAIKGLHLTQPFNLSSACGTPEFTNFTTGFAACLDYIFYDQDHIKVDQIIPLPSNDELKANIALPSVVFPSDHIALVSDLKWI